MSKAALYLFLFSLMIIIPILALNSGPKSVIDLIENYYANMLINRPNNKQKYFKVIKKLNPESSDYFELLGATIRKMGDAHLFLFSNNSDPKFTNDLRFHLGKKIYLLKKLEDEL